MQLKRHQSEKKLLPYSLHESGQNKFQERNHKDNLSDLKKERSLFQSPEKDLAPFDSISNPNILKSKKTAFLINNTLRKTKSP
jgi:hypothetical protein